MYSVDLWEVLKLEDCFSYGEVVVEIKMKGFLVYLVLVGVIFWVVILGYEFE